MGELNKFRVATTVASLDQSEPARNVKELRMPDTLPEEISQFFDRFVEAFTT